MPQVSYQYNGHTITVELTEDKPDSWSWSYSIDGEGHWENQARPLASREALLVEAKIDAQRRVDIMNLGH